MTETLWDMHVHLDFMQDPEEIAKQANHLNLGLFAVTVEPKGYIHVKEALIDLPNVRLAVGLHPWWVADGRCNKEDIEIAVKLAEMSPFIGEIGLDASPKHVPEGSLSIQISAFEKICKACGENSDPAFPKILSIHSVQAAGQALDILENTSCLEKCRCIFHWFTGSGDELNRAIKCGCFFSINPMMLRTRRGKEYARQIPENRLLLETDLPPGENLSFSANEINASIEQALEDLSIIRNKNIRSILTANTHALLKN